MLFILFYLILRFDEFLLPVSDKIILINWNSVLVFEGDMLFVDS